MVDLNSKSAYTYWANYPDKTVYKVIKQMDTMEDWTLDGHADVEAALTKLADSMNHLDRVTLTEHGDIIEMIAYLKTSRYLTILQNMDIKNPGSAAKVISHAEKNAQKSPAHQLFLQRNIAFERFRLLSRIFNSENLNMLVKSLEGSDN